MTVPFIVGDNRATLTVDVDGQAVEVAVIPKTGLTLTEEDAAVILTGAMTGLMQFVRAPKFEVDVEGHKVVIAFKDRTPMNLTQDEAKNILMRAMPHFPQCARFPEPLRR
jgi:hypothetical protein